MDYIGDFFIAREIRLAPGITAAYEKITLGATALCDMDAQAAIPGNCRLCSCVLKNCFLCHVSLQSRLAHRLFVDLFRQILDEIRVE